MTDYKKEVLDFANTLTSFSNPLDNIALSIGLERKLNESDEELKKRIQLRSIVV